MSQPQGSFSPNSSENHSASYSQHVLDIFWGFELGQIQNLRCIELKGRKELPLTRIMKLIKQNENARKVSKDALVLLTKATELYIKELSFLAWTNTEKHGRITLKRKNIVQSIIEHGQFDFLIDGLTEEEVKKVKANCDFMVQRHQEVLQDQTPGLITRDVMVQQHQEALQQQTPGPITQHTAQPQQRSVEIIETNPDIRQTENTETFPVPPILQAKAETSENSKKQQAAQQEEWACSFEEFEVQRQLWIQDLLYNCDNKKNAERDSNKNGDVLSCLTYLAPNQLENSPMEIDRELEREMDQLLTYTFL